MNEKLVSALECGAPGTTRTCDLLVRSQKVAVESAGCKPLEPTQTVKTDSTEVVLGGVSGGVLIPLSRGYSAVIDDSDYLRVSAHQWRPRISKGRGVYAVAKIDGNSTEMGKFLLALPAGRSITADHKSGNTLDNRRHNLRPASVTQQNRNQRKRPPRSNNGAPYSKHKGVYWNSTTAKWLAQIRIDGGKRLHLGLFATEMEAALAYNIAAVKHHGEFRRENAA